MATHLHDGACQELAISRLKIQSFLSEHDIPEASTLEETCDAIDQVACELRELTLDLSPPTLYKFGLEAAVEELLDEHLRSTHGISYEFFGDTDAGLLADNLQVLLFRSIRELIINVIKHAQAHMVKVAIERHPESVQVVVEDDGVGFDVEGAKASVSKAGGFGLFNIKERVEYVGGSFEIHSSPGSGSRFMMTAPVVARVVSG
jgi:signal transduction histidine kinase